MDERVTLITLFYFIFSICFVMKTNEFVSAGITVENLFSNFLGSETENFVLYQIKRSSWTLFSHSLLIFGYHICLTWVTKSPLFDDHLTLLNVIGTIGLILPIATGIILYRCRKNNWENHPIARRLSLFTGNAGTMNWQTLASDINVEFRRLDKITIKCSSLIDVVVTDNWIIKVTPYNMYLAHQSNTSLSVDTADTHVLSATGPGSAQFLNIRVSFNRRGNHYFYIRLNALDFRDLEEKLQRPIIVAQNIVFHQTIADQFLEVFKEQVLQNPPYHPTEDVEMCIGCMVNLSNVKLVKNCSDDILNTCRNCYCRPLWCVSCMGRWFASRQEEVVREQWLSSKCTCPVCRSVFCILDVSPIEGLLHDN